MGGQKMKRPVCVALMAHTAQMGGAEHALLRLVESMDRSRWHPVVVFAEDGPAVQKLRLQSVETYVRPMDALLSGTRKGSLSTMGCIRPRRIAGLVSHVIGTMRFFRERGVQIVHTNSLKAHVYAGLAARLSGIPLVWHLRDTIHRSYLPAASVRGMRLLGAVLPDRVVAVSRSVAIDLLGKDPRRKSTVVYDGLRETDFGPCPSDCPGEARGNPAAGAQIPTLGMVGRITSWKGQHVFIEAAAFLKQRGFALRLEIVGAPLFGEEAYRRELQSLVQHWGVEDRVTFLGAVEDVPQRIRAWTALVHASISPDPCPNVVLEAMAAGVPVVGSDGGGVPEILEEGRLGWLFPMGNASALADVLEGILSNPSKALAIARDAWAHASRFFTSRRVAEEVERCWSGLECTGGWRKRWWPQLEEFTGEDVEEESEHEDLRFVGKGEQLEVLK
jgi:glycosyltransferase involved in cell wall biosynthesis